MATEIGKAYVQIVPSAEGISGSISQALGGEAKSAGKTAGSSIGTSMSVAIGSALGGALTAAAGGIVSGVNGILSSIGNTASYGDSIDKMSQKMGLTAEAYQEWDAVMRHSGSSIETMKTSMKTLASAAETGSDAFEALGISAEQLTGMSQQDLFEATIAALQNVEDTTQRTYLAGKLLGRGATELGALLNTSAEDTQAMRDRVHELGGVLSDEAVKAAAGYQDSLQDLGTAFQSVGRSVISDFLPSVTTVMDGLTDIISGNVEEGKETLIEGVTGFLQELPNAVRRGATIVTAVIGAAKDIIPELISTLTGFLPEVMGASMDLLLSLVDGVLNSLPDLLNALLGVVMLLVDKLADNAPTILQALVTAVSGLINNLATFLSENGVLLLSTVMKLATSIILALPELIPQLIDAAVNLIDAVLITLLDFLPEFFEASTDMTLALIDGLMDALPQIGSSAGKIVSTLLSAIIEHLPEILITAVKLDIEFAAGLIKAIPKILGAVRDLIFEVVYGFQRFIEETNWAELGLNIISGIKDGILGAAGELVSAVTDVGGKAVNGLKNFFGISSPSKLMRDQVGKFIPEGLALGIEDEEDEVSGAMNLLGSGTLRGARASLAQSGAALGAGNFAAAAGPSQFVIPVYIGDRLLDTVVTEATNRYNFKSGGR